MRSVQVWAVPPALPPGAAASKALPAPHTHADGTLLLASQRAAATPPTSVAASSGASDAASSDGEAGEVLREQQQTQQQAQQQQLQQPQAPWRVVQSLREFGGGRIKQLTVAHERSMLLCLAGALPPVAPAAQMAC